MGRAVSHAGLIPEDVGDAVAVMHVPVEDRHASRRICLKRRRRRRRRTIHETKPHGGIRGRMVAGRARQREGRAEPVCSEGSRLEPRARAIDHSLP